MTLYGEMAYEKILEAEANHEHWQYCKGMIEGFAIAGVLEAGELGTLMGEMKMIRKGEKDDKGNV